MYTYQCELDRVIDGDTVDVGIDLGFDVWIKQRVRLYGLDAPETRTRDLEEKKQGLLAKAFVEEFFRGSGPFTVKTQLGDRRGKYGRVLGTFYDTSLAGLTAGNLNASLLDQELAKLYMGGKR